MPYIILISIMTFFVTFFIGPMVVGFFISFTDWNGMSSAYQFVGFENYTSIFSDMRFLNALKVTLLYSSVLLVSCLVLGYLSAKALCTLRHNQAKAFFISFFPYVITPVIVCILWGQIYTNLIPMVGSSLNIEWLSHNLLSSKQFAIFAVSFVDLWMLIPYAMILFSSAINSIPKDLNEYAQVEGASFWKRFKYIELPHLAPTIGMISTVVFSYSFTGLDTIMTLTAGGPGRSTETLYYLIYKNSTLEQRYGYGLAEGILVSLVSIGVFILISRMTNGKNVDDITMGT